MHWPFTGGIPTLNRGGSAMTFPNKQQRRALYSSSKYSICIAPAGAGKTELLAQKAIEEARRLNGKRYRLSVKKPHALILTHTTYARDNIQERINIIEPTYLVSRTIEVKTFHGYGLKIINRYDPSFYVVSDDCDEQILQKILTEGVVRLPHPPEMAMPEILSVIKDQRKQRLSLKKVIKRKYPHLKDKIKFIRQVARELERRKQKEGIISIDEIPSVFNQLVKNRTISLKSITQSGIIIVDEFHDTLFAQWEMIKNLTRSNTWLFVAGDPDQNIFEWAGASRKRFDDFRKHFPSYTEFPLTVNYRSSNEIVTLCNHIRMQVKNNSGLKNRGATNGPKPFVVCSKSKVDLSDYIVKKILKQLKSGKSLDDIAVIYRFHRDRRILIERLNAKNIPHKVFESRFLKIRPIIRVIFAAHHVIEKIDEQDPKSGIWAHWRTLLMNVEGIGNRSIEQVISWIRNRRRGFDYTYPKSNRVASPLREFLYAIEKIASTTKDSTPKTRLSSIVQLILSLPKVNKSRLDKELASLFYLASRFDSFNDVIARYQDKSYPTCYPAGCQKPPFPDEYLTLSTIHRIKGSGFDTVFYLGTDNFLYARYRCFEGTNRLHEVRLMNVACSRAKQNLIILFNVDRSTWKNKKKANDYPNPWGIIRKISSKTYNIKHK
jgi:DNA helicase-2/ATP-dependent DNA helicase PcrA